MSESLKNNIASLVQPIFRHISKQIYWFIGIAAVGAVTFFAAGNYILRMDMKNRVNINQTILENIGQSLHSALTNPGELFYNVFSSAKKVTFDNLIVNNKELITRDFELLVDSYRGLILQLRLLNKAGKEELRVNFQGGKAVPVVEFDMQDKSQSDYFRKAKQLEKDQLFISEIDLNRERGKIAEPRQTTVRFIAKGFDEKDNFRGFFVANFKIPELDRRINGFTNHWESKIRIWNEDRQIIGSNEPGQLHKIYGSKENIPFYSNDGEVLPKSNVVSVQLPIKINEHIYTVELYTEIKNITGQGINKNIPLYFALMAMGISGLVVVTANWRSKAKRSEYFQQVNEDLQKETSSVLLLQKIAISSNESSTVEGALQTCIDLICDYTSWSVGHVYMLAKDNPKKLLPTDIWCFSNPHEFKVFQKVTEETSFNSGEGLPGRVLHSGKPAWIVDVTKDSNFPRAKLAENIGVKTGFAFPVLKGTNVVGVMEFFSSCVTEPNEKLLKVVANIGIQLGRIVERKEAGENLQKSKGQLERTYNELKIKQAELTVSARLVDCGTMAAGIAHDFNNILTGIRGNAELALDESDSEKIRSSLKTIEKLVEEAAELTRRLRVVGKATKPEMGRVDIEEVIEEGLSILRNQFAAKGIEVKVKYTTQIPLITGDKAQLRNVITNLALNAMCAMEDFMAQQRTNEENQKMQLTIICKCKNRELKIAISDTGGGISKENLDHIFTPFFTTKKLGSERGTGLGLSMVVATIETHDGRLEYESYTPEMIKKDPRLSDKIPGTTFRIILPVKEPPKEVSKKSQKDTEDQEVKYPDALIYFVEDEEIIRSIIKKMLSRAGYKNVRVFANGRLALEALNDSVKEGDSLPDLILSDVRMPEMDGLSLCKEVSKIVKPQQTSFAIMAGDYSGESIKPFKEFGDFLVGSISKPFSTNNLKRCVADALKKHFSKKAKTI